MEELGLFVRLGGYLVGESPPERYKSAPFL